MPNILSFPMPAEHALALIRQAVGEGRVRLLSPPAGGDWYRVVTHRQVALCLKKGEMVAAPEIDGHGNVTCWLERFGAGLTVRLHLVLKKNQNDEWEILVIEVENQL